MERDKIIQDMERLCVAFNGNKNFTGIAVDDFQVFRKYDAPSKTETFWAKGLLTGEKGSESFNIPIEKDDFNKMPWVTVWLAKEQPEYLDHMPKQMAERKDLMLPLLDNALNNSRTKEYGGFILDPFLKDNPLKNDLEVAERAVKLHDKNILLLGMPIKERIRNEFLKVPKEELGKMDKKEFCLGVIKQMQQERQLKINKGKDMER